MYTVYGKESCHFCVKTKDLLESQEEAYDYVDVKEDAESLEYIKSLGCSTVPQVFHEDDHIGGYMDLVAYFG